MITIEGSEVFIDGKQVGCLADALANYHSQAAEIQAAWDEAHPPEPAPEEAP